MYLEISVLENKFEKNKKIKWIKTINKLKKCIIEIVQKIIYLKWQVKVIGKVNNREKGGICKNG